MTLHLRKSIPSDLLDDCQVTYKIFEDVTVLRGLSAGLFLLTWQKLTL